MLVVLVVSLAVPALASALQAPPLVASAESTFERLNTLTDQDVVLVAYEWDARRGSELMPLESTVIAHLIQNNVRFVAVSTDPQGALLQYNLRYQLPESYIGGGQDYILLGYKPGGELALRLLARDFRGALRSDFVGSDATTGGLANGLHNNRPLNQLSDLSAVVVLADDPVDVQGWMEQVRPSIPGLPLVFLLPEETAPIIQPYARQPDVYYLPGKRGALAYQGLRGAAPSEQIAQESGQQRLALLVFVLLLLGGTLALGVSRLLGRQRKPS